jgi:hypothetical protein
MKPRDTGVIFTITFADGVCARAQAIHIQWVAYLLPFVIHSERSFFDSRAQPMPASSPVSRRAN